MGQERATLALERMERALARIEAAAGRTPEPPPRDDAELDELKDAYRALRGRVEAAAAQLDSLLVGTGGDG